MTGSGASNLGYGNIPPLSNINGRYVNVDNSHYSGGFSSNEIPGLPGISGTKNNVDAAAGIFKGGAKKLKIKIKNITKHYKRMKRGSKKYTSLKNRLKSKHISRMASRQIAGRRRKSRKYSRRLKQHGGSQYQNNLPLTRSYQVAGIPLSASNSALANPAPITLLSNDGSCRDNYNHFSGTSFSSRGH